MTEEKKKLFLVEDEPFLREILAAKLIKEGFVVTEFGESVDVKAAASEQQPDLILLDIVMPEKNGFDVMDELSNDPKTSTIPILMLTNLSQEADKEKAKSMGAKDYLVKSNFSPDDITKKIREIL